MMLANVCKWQYALPLVKCEAVVNEVVVVCRVAPGAMR